MSRFVIDLGQDNNLNLTKYKFIYIPHSFHKRTHQNGLIQKLLSYSYVILTVLFVDQRYLYTNGIEIKISYGSSLPLSIYFLALKWLKRYRLV